MYNWRVAAVHNALAERGKATGPLTVDDLISLGHLDQYHYHGVEACDKAAAILGLDSSSKVLDIGSGIGGPARYLSVRTGCDVTGVELQADLTQAATELTARTGLANRVRFITGDFVSLYTAQHADLQKASFDHFISQLVFLHIPDRPQLLKTCFETTKPGGTFLIEDFVQVGPAFTSNEKSMLLNDVHAQTVTTRDEYIAALEDAGFVDVQTIDLTEGWREWSMARYKKYVESKEETVKMHGESVYNGRSAFYKVVADLFDGGNLGGACITGRKRGINEQKLYDGLAHGTSSVASKAVLNEYGSTVRK
jgi:cyclopropane fatty-acyl-phospholipid synthase-like methyltransferase